MLQSKLFSKTSKQFYKEEKSANARFLIKGGFVSKLMAGVYSFLPLGLRVKKKIENIIREELNKIGAQEILMPAVQPQKIWEQTNRFKDLSEIMYQFVDRAGKKLVLGPTHEEIVTELAKPIILSYQDLPISVYQIQTKFRDEPRARSGLIRGREFTMKDLYSFHQDQADLEKYYQKLKKVYLRIFKRCGLTAIVTEASGGYFSKYSHEFMVESPSGEDTIFWCENCKFSQNKEISSLKEGQKCPRCGKGTIKKTRAIEVGNIFKLGTRFSESLDLRFRTKTGELKPVVMGCYGIGIERTLATVVEVNHDSAGIIWPEEISPYQYHLLILSNDKEVEKFAKKVYAKLKQKSAEVLCDDRKVSAGEKFADADLIGIPNRLVVSPKTKAVNKIEIKKRNQTKKRLVSLRQLLNKI